MLFPKVNKISVHISTVLHITEQKLCCTFTNCSLWDNQVCLRSLALCAYEISVRIRTFSTNSHSNVVKFEFELCHISNELTVDLGARAEAAKLSQKTFEPKPENIWASQAEPEKFWHHNFLIAFFHSNLWTFTALKCTKWHYLMHIYIFAFAFAFAFGVDYVQRWGRPSIAAQCATPDITKG